MGWLKKMRKKNPGAPLLRIAWWTFLQTCLLIYLKIFYRHFSRDYRNIPDEGPVLLISNHQSFLDLPVIGVGIWHRHFQSMARETLFRGLLGWIIRTLNGFPVDQESKGDIKAMRATVQKLSEGHLLLVFPEGSRTHDGAIGKFKKGIMLILRRAKPTVVPAALEGVYDIWPMGQKWPKWRGRTAAKYGEPIDAEFLLAMDPEEALEYLRRKVDDLRLELRAEIRQRSNGRYPKPGLGDKSVVELTETSDPEPAPVSTA